MNATLLVLSLTLAAADAPAEMPLWPKGAPGAVGETSNDKPTLTVYRPAKPTGASVVVCPGGGYVALALEHEGKEIADWLSERGVTAFVLKYRRAPRYKHPAPLQDVQRAIRTVRSRAKEWELDTNKIGVWGFSAGGHLASCAATMFEDGKPDARMPSSVYHRGRLRHSLLSRHRHGRTADASRLAQEPPRRRSARRPCQEDVHLHPGNAEDAADVFVPHRRRRRSPSREQHPVLPRAQEGEGAGRAAHLRRGAWASAWRRRTWY